MTTYTQYDTTSSIVSSEIGTTYQLTWTCSGILSDAVRYNAGSGVNIAFETSSNAPGNVHVWRDDGVGFPAEFSDDNVNWASSCADAQTIYIRNIGGGSHSFTSPQWQYSSANPANSSGGGTSTEGVATVQWSASFSKNPGDDYWRWTVTGLNTDSTDYIYLYDEMPTSTSTHQPIGTRTFTSSSSSSTQYGLFIPDITKTYYVINFLSGGSFEILATKNFGRNKVFSNFW